MNNNLIEIQEALLNQIKRIDNNETTNLQEEISRGNTLTGMATAFIKSVNVGLRIIETSKNLEISQEKLSKNLGVSNEK